MARIRLARFALLGSLLLAGCIAPRATAGTIEVTVIADGRTLAVSIPAGSTAQQAIERAGLTLGALDSLDPPGFTVLTEGSAVTLTRRTERFEIEERVIPFARQTVQNEGLPTGETRLLQAGMNGSEELTYRIVEEEGVEVSRQIVKRVVVIEANPEILMVGSQAVHTPLAFEGTLAMLSAGNAWVLRGDSTQRRPLVVSGDLDGQVFRLSPDGNWLLFSRAAEEGEGQDFNGLWLISTVDPEAEPLDLGARNVVHFADWSPDASALRVAYTTVEPRQSPPGWQANNDLILIELDSEGAILERTELLAPSAGGQYGWWGTSFAWAPDGVHIAYAQADSIGVIDLRDPAFEILYNITPFETRSDWAWVPGLAWGHNSRTLYLVDHGAPVGLEDPSASPVFDLIAVGTPGAGPIRLVRRSGMFAYPSVSPRRLLESGEVAHRVAFLQARSPLESESSSYQLMVMDRDGSNLGLVFPDPAEPGIGQDDLAQPAWSPNGEQLAVIYRGNLWVVDLRLGTAQPLTGDGLTLAADWKP